MVEIEFARIARQPPLSCPEPTLALLEKQASPAPPVRGSLEKAPEGGSPFLQRSSRRFSFSTLLIMLLTVVGAGVGLLIYYALRVPAISSEVNAWLGRPSPAVDVGDARQAQLIFALCVYTAPLTLGIFVYILHFLLNALNRRTEAEETDERFRMD